MDSKMTTAGAIVSIESELCSSDSERELQQRVFKSTNGQDCDANTSSPLLQHAEPKMVPDCGYSNASLIPKSCSTDNFRLSDAVSVISGEEITQRREALKLFSSQVSMASCTHKSSFAQMPAVIVSYELTPFSSTLSSLHPICRICQCPAEVNNVLISPCRCSGSLKFIHGTCLRKWLEVLERKHKHTGPSFCELCGYIYRKHKFLKRKDFRWPRVSLRDKILHSVFAFSFCLMIGCAIATVMCFTTDKEELADRLQNQVGVGSNGKLANEEVITIGCGVTFFLSFFVAMSVELKAKHAIHYIFRRFIRYNTIWLIENYNPANDKERQRISEKSAAAK